jgi:hypothetical protein
MPRGAFVRFVIFLRRIMTPRDPDALSISLLPLSPAAGLRARSRSFDALPGGGAWIMGGVGSWLGELSIDCRARQVAKRVDCALSAGEVGGDAKSADWKRAEGALWWEVSQESADGRSMVIAVRIYF